MHVGMHAGVCAMMIECAIALSFFELRAEAAYEIASPRIQAHCVSPHQNISLLVAGSFCS